MKIYQISIVISGHNGNPETRQERVLASDWQDVCRIMSDVCRDTGCVIQSMAIAESKYSPFDCRTIKQLDTA